MDLERQITGFNMAHFAEIDSNTNRVLRVLVINNSDVENNGGEYTSQSEEWVKNNHPNPDGNTNVYWKQTSYNTIKGKHYVYLMNWHEPIGTDRENVEGIGRILSEDQSKAKRKNYAGVGYTYDSSRDAFIPPNDDFVDHYVLDENTCTWTPPTAYPEDGNVYEWMPETQTWEITEDTEHHSKPAYCGDW